MKDRETFFVQFLKKKQNVTKESKNFKWNIHNTPIFIFWFIETSPCLRELYVVYFVMKNLASF